MENKKILGGPTEGIKIDLHGDSAPSGNKQK